MKKFYRRSISGLLALLICFTTILSSGVTAFAASSSGETAKSYSVAFPRDGDANLDTSGTWGHDELHYMNGWTSGEKTWMTTLHTIGDFNGPACYCIEPGVPRLLERTYARYGEDYWNIPPSATAPSTPIPSRPCWGGSCSTAIRGTCPLAGVLRMMRMPISWLT